MDISTLSKNEILDAFSPSFDSGYLEIRTGATPGADVAATGTLLATVTFAATAFGASASAIITAAAIASDNSTDAAGTIGYVRAFKSGATVIGDFTVSLTGNGGEVQFDSLSVSALGTLNMTAFTLFM